MNLLRKSDANDFGGTNMADERGKKLTLLNERKNIKPRGSTCKMVCMDNFVTWTQCLDVVGLGYLYRGYHAV